MFTTTIVLSVLKGAFKNTISFFWEYKWIVLTTVIIVALYLRGNSYKEDYQNEVSLHNKSVLQHQQDLDKIKLDSETALRKANEKALTEYKALVLKTNQIQEKYNVQKDSIDSTIASISADNDRLLKQIRQYTNSGNTSGGSEERNTTDAQRLFIISGLLETCSTESIYYANEAAKLSNSVKALQEWGSLVLGGDKELN